MTPLALTIRQAQLADAPVLAEAERQIARTPGSLVSCPEELPDSKFAAKISELAQVDDGRYLVAEQGGEIIGHALLEALPLRAIRHVVHLTIAVHPGWQGQGVGRALLGELIEWARQAPAVEKVELHVRSGNGIAQALYRKMGFVEEGRWRRRVKLGPGEYMDDVLMGLWVG